MTAAFILVCGCAAHPKTICKRPQKITAEYFAHIYVFIFQDLQIQTHGYRSRQTSLFLPPCISMRPIPFFCGDFVSFHFYALRLNFLLIYGPLQFVTVVHTYKSWAQISLISVGVPWGLNIIIPNAKKRKRKEKDHLRTKVDHTQQHTLLSPARTSAHTQAHV